MNCLRYDKLIQQMLQRVCVCIGKKYYKTCILQKAGITILQFNLAVDRDSPIAEPSPTSRGTVTFLSRDPAVNSTQTGNVSFSDTVEFSGSKPTSTTE